MHAHLDVYTHSQYRFIHTYVICIKTHAQTHKNKSSSMFSTEISFNIKQAMFAIFVGKQTLI